MRTSYIDPDSGRVMEISLYLDADGGRHVVSGAAAEDGAVTLIKVGKKYYPSRNGEIGAEEWRGGLVTIDSFDSLSAADRKWIEQYQCFAQYTSGYPSYDDRLAVYVGSDGAVVANGTVFLNGRTCHTNRFGFVYEELNAPFFKVGKTWYVNTACVSDQTTLYSINGWKNAVVSTAADGRLLGIYEAGTGKKLSGDYSLPSMPVNITLKNGLPATGTRRVKSQGFSYTYQYDAQLGCCLVN